MKLWVIRHAKSSWADPGQADFDRPLNGRGIKDGQRMSLWMKDEREPPQRIVSSDAARAEATAEFVRDGFSVSADRFSFEHRLYEASPVTIRDVVRELPDDCPSAALVGHNPGSTDFVNAMVGKHVVDQLADIRYSAARRCRRHGRRAIRHRAARRAHTPKSLRD